MNQINQLIPNKVREQINIANPILSHQGKVVLRSILEDGSIYLSDGIEQAQKNDSLFGKKLTSFLLKRKKETIKDMEEQEKQKEQESLPNF